MDTIECGKKLILNFENGTILRAETLNQQNLYAEQIRKYMYSDYPDGIVKGFSLVECEEGWHLTSGIAKLNNEIYVLNKVNDEDISSLGEELDCDYYLCLKKKLLDRNNIEITANNNDVDSVIDSIPKEYSKYIRENKPESYELLELCAIKESKYNNRDYILVAKFMKSAGRIRTSKSIKEYKEGSNKFSTLDGDYSIPGEKATSVDFTQLIKKSLEEKKDRDYLDISLYMACLSQRCLSRNCLLFYCSCKLNREVEWLEITDSLFKAIEKNITPFYQEKLNTPNKTLRKTEFNHNY